MLLDGVASLEHHGAVNAYCRFNYRERVATFRAAVIKSDEMAVKYSV